MENSELQYNDEIKAMLNDRYEDYKSGKEKIISEEECREEILNLLAAKDNSLA
jgi:hypothetical protein